MVRLTLASALVWCFAAAADPRCEEGCAVARNSAESAKREACREQWRTLPRPKIGLACSAGFFLGFDESCLAVCDTFIGKGFDELGAMPRKDQGAACAAYRQVQFVAFVVVLLLLLLQNTTTKYYCEYYY